MSSNVGTPTPGVLPADRRVIPDFCSGSGVEDTDLSLTPWMSSRVTRTTSVVGFFGVSFTAADLAGMVIGRLMAMNPAGGGGGGGGGPAPVRGAIAGGGGGGGGAGVDMLTGAAGAEEAPGPAVMLVSSAALYPSDAIMP